MKNNNTRFIPFLLAICLIAGIAIGTFYANHFSGNKLGIINTSSNKLNALLRIIDDQYVDTVNMGELVEEARFFRNSTRILLIFRPRTWRL